MADTSLFGRLKRLFSSDVIIRNVGGDQLKVIDTDRIQSLGALQTNALVDRFTKIYTTSGAGVYNLNNVLNYQTMRVQLYTDYEAMDTDAIVASALDIIADECTLKNDFGEVIHIKSSDENIQKILRNLFYDVLNIEFTLWSWTRNMCKYGDFYLKLEISEKFGVYNVIPFSSYAIIREEGSDVKNPTYVRFKYDPTSVAGTTMGYGVVPPQAMLGNADGLYFENYEMAHFRLLSDVNFLPYGRSYLEPGRKIFKQYGFLQRRGYLLYGPPGTGKTVLVKQIIDRIVKDKGIVILSNAPPSIVSKALQYLNRIEPTRQIVCVYEDIDAIIGRWGEAELLALLDGEDSTDHVLNIATTNYPEKLDKRIISRPRRFDRIIKIGYPDAEMRKYYFKHKMPDISDEELNSWVKNTDEFTFAALTELVISVKCLGNNVDAAINGLKLLLGNKPNSSEFKPGGGSIGFKI